MFTKPATFACLITLLAILATACGGGRPSPVGKSATASPTQAAVIDTKEAIPTPTALPMTGPQCPVDDTVCTTATAFATLLSKGGDAIAAASHQSEFTCPPAGDSVGLQPACTDTNAGTTQSGYSIGDKMLELVDRAGLASALDTWITPNGQQLQFHIVSVACPRTSEAASLDCSKYFAAGYAAPISPSSPQVQQVIMVAFARSTQSSPAPVAFRTQSYDPTALTASWGRPVDGGWAQFDYGVTLPGATELPGKVWFIPWNPNKAP